MENQNPQFSLAAVLITIAVIAGVLGLMFQAPIVPATIGLLVAVFVISSLAFTGLVYGRANMKVFCIGALPPLVVMLLFVAMDTVATMDPFVLAGTELSVEPEDNTAIPGTPRFYGTGILASIALGYLCVGFRSFLTRNQPPRS